MEFTVDMRSVSMTELQKLDAAFMDILKRHEATDVTLETLLLGKRPCGDGPLRDEIYERIMRIRRREGKMTKWAASSTDANIALSRGLPAMAFGVGHEKASIPWMRNWIYRALRRASNSSRPLSLISKL